MDTGRFDAGIAQLALRIQRKRLLATLGWVAKVKAGIDQTPIDVVGIAILAHDLHTLLGSFSQSVLAAFRPLFTLFTPRRRQ